MMDIDVVIFGIVAIVMTALAVVQWRRGRRVGQTLREVRADDPEFGAAEEQAAAGLTTFLDRLRAPRAGDSDFMVKVRLPTHPPEQIWMEDLSFLADGQLRGRFANESAAGFRLGEQLDFHCSRITDWGYRQQGIMRGHHSTRVFISRLPAHERDRMFAEFGWR